MKQNLLSFFLSLCLVGALQAQVDVTFSVDMSEYSGSFTTVYVAGSFNGWSDVANPLADDDGDGVWEGTVALNPATYEYKFQVDAWADQEFLTPGSSCTITTGEFTNRLIEVTEAVTLPTVCWGSCDACGAGPVEGNITFSVDMSEYSGSFTTVYVAGAFNGWSDVANPLADDDGDGVWEATILLPGGNQEYKFQVDAWADQENLTPGSACTITTDGFTNRLIAVDGDATLPTVCWNSCDACGAGGMEGNITFRVDMNDYNGDAFTTVAVAGAFNGWCGDCNLLADDDGDGVWEGTFLLPGGNQEFKFVLDNWAVQELFSPGGSCTLTTGEFTNRLVVVDGDATLPAYCWNSCDACGVGPAAGNITLKVDMSEYTGTFTTVFAAGGFNGWCGGCDPLADDDGDGIWEGTVAMPGGNNQYKFQVDEWADDEQFAGGESCTFTEGEFTNRLVVVDGDATVETVCWASCEPCQSSGINDLAIDRNFFQLQPNITGQLTSVHFSEVLSGDAQLILTDLQGRTLSQEKLGPGTQLHRLDVSSLPNGIYLVAIRTAEKMGVQRIVVER